MSHPLSEFLSEDFEMPIISIWYGKRETKCECTLHAFLHNKFSEMLNQRERSYFLTVSRRPKFSETIITIVFLKFCPKHHIEKQSIKITLFTMKRPINLSHDSSIGYMHYDNRWKTRLNKTLSISGVSSDKLPYYLIKCPLVVTVSI